MRVKIINRSHHPLPEYATVQSAGVDLRANLEEPVVMKPMERRLIPTGLFISLPAGFEAQVRPRSGLAIKKGITVLNTPGTIDADYRGEIGVILINLSQDDFKWLLRIMLVSNSSVTQMSSQLVAELLFFTRRSISSE